MLEFKYDTQLLIEERILTKMLSMIILPTISKETACWQLAMNLIKIHFHTNEPWKVLEYCSTLGEIYDIVVEDMDRQARGLQG